MGLQIISGVSANTPCKIMVYANPGVGKTTLCAKHFNKPLILDLEDGSKFLDVDRVNITTSNELFAAINSLVASAEKVQKKYKTIVIDSLDWTVAKIVSNILGIENEKDPIKLKAALDNTLAGINGGYGKGQQALNNRLRERLLPKLAELVNAGFTVVCTSHAMSSEIMDAEGATQKTVAPSVGTLLYKSDAQQLLDSIMQWFDHILYLKKNDDNTRELVPTSNTYVLAKNRLGFVDNIEVTDDLDLSKLLSPASKKDNKGEKGDEDDK